MREEEGCFPVPGTDPLWGRLEECGSQIQEWMPASPRPLGSNSAPLPCPATGSACMSRSSSSTWWRAWEGNPQGDQRKWLLGPSGQRGGEGGTCSTRFLPRVLDLGHHTVPCTVTAPLKFVTILPVSCGCQGDDALVRCFF